MNETQVKERLISSLKMFEGGGGLSVGGLFLRYHESNGKRLLDVTGDTLWSPKILTKKMALKELEEIKDLFKRFTEVSMEFSNFTSGCELRFHLDYNYGMGSKGICSEVLGIVTWDEFYLDFEK
ncbi:MAG TPA: hypothetical protein VFW78_04335 [Bacteroidia bacterium]|nr:hypothetical protein [Bacteroidia bacterium]